MKDELLDLYKRLKTVKNSGIKASVWNDDDCDYVLSETFEFLCENEDNICEDWTI